MLDALKALIHPDSIPEALTNPLQKIFGKPRNILSEERQKRHAAFLERFVSPKNRAVERMTNWQRIQWMRAGCPQSMTSIKRYLQLDRKSSIQEKRSHEAA